MILIKKGDNYSTLAYVPEVEVILSITAALQIEQVVITNHHILLTCIVHMYLLAVINFILWDLMNK